VNFFHAFGLLLERFQELRVCLRDRGIVNKCGLPREYELMSYPDWLERKGYSNIICEVGGESWMLEVISECFGLVNGTLTGRIHVAWRVFLG